MPLPALLAETPALPMHEAGKYVAGAYIVFVVLLVVYVGIMASKLQRIERELREVANVAEDRRLADDQAAPGRGSAESSISDSLTPHGSGGGGV
jgi:flagellar biosynthesis/type III secretory pathway M-ring protein FliF/YscJ